MIDRLPYGSIFLPLLFLASFAIPVYLCVQLANSLWSGEAELEQAKSVFQSPTVIHGPGTFIKVAHSDELNPTPDLDFMLVSWFRLSRLPADGERMVLISKYDMDTDARAGYSVGLQRDGDKLRPIVYWKSIDREGGWHTFAEMRIPARSWFMLAVSFRKGSLLGVHAGLEGKDGFGLQLLGGFDTGMSAIPTSRADLTLGSFNTSKFKGMVGPVALFARANLSKSLEKLLEEIVQSPTELPKRIDRDAVKLWMPDGKVDASPYSHTIELVTNSRKSIRELTALRINMPSRRAGQQPPGV